MTSLPMYLLEICPDPSLFLTITFVQSSRRYKTLLNEAVAEKALQWFICRLNKAIFGHGVKRKGFKCGVVTFLENRTSNIHAHLALQLPSNSEIGLIKLTIQDLIRKGNWFDKEYDIQSCYFKEGLMEYIAKEGQDSMIVSCTHKALP